MLAFEVHATNLSNGTVAVKSVRIEADGKLVAAFSGKMLDERVRFPGPMSSHAPAEIGAGERAIVYIEADLVRNAHPETFRVKVDCLRADGQGFSVTSSVKAVDRSPVPVLTPPFRKGNWVAVHSPFWERGHRRVTYAAAGQLRIPGRYAVDWVGVDEKGLTTHGNPDRPSDATGYGMPVLAGADAIVAATRDGMDESASISHNPSRPQGDGSGNYVILRLNSRRFAFYEHLQPGSIRVKPGEHVHAGQVIGALGFSGDTTGPHLHLHVANCPSPLECEGEPFAIRGMIRIGQYDSLTGPGARRWNPARPSHASRPEWPDYNIVVKFSR